MSILQRLKQVNSPGPPEESIAFRVAVMAAVVAGEVAVLREGVGTPALWLACVAGTPFAFFMSYRTRHADRFWLKAGIAGALFVALARFARTASSLETASIADVQIPLAELFLWVQLLHGLDVPARRDLMFSLSSSVTLVIVAGVLSVDTSYAIYLFAWGVAALAGLVLAHRSELAELRPLAPKGASRPSMAAMRQLRSLPGVGVLILVLGAGLFLVLPPAGGARSLTFPHRVPRPSSAVADPGGLSNPSLGDADPAISRRERTAGRRGGGAASYGYFGFSDSLDTAVRGRPDNTLVMRVRASQPDFWRGQTFDVWDGREWKLAEVDSRPLSRELPIDLGGESLGNSVEAGDPTFVQTFFIERPGPNVIFGAYQPRQLYVDSAAYQLDDGTIRAGVNFQSGAVYTVVSHRPSVTEETLRRADGQPESLPQEFRDRYLQLPEVPERVRELAISATAGASSRYDKVLALEKWIADNTRYSLDPPELLRGEDAVEQFLFEDKVGFCEQIGSSLVVMLRSVGIPARLVVGFAAGERNPFTGLFEVRGSDAHAWAEVYFPGVGWQGFDPTADVPLAGNAGISSAGSGVLRYLGAHLPSPPVWAVGFVAVVAAAASIMLGGAVFLRSIASRRRSERERSWSEECLRRIEKIGSAGGRPRRPSETAREYGGILRRANLAGIEVLDVVDALDSDAFGREPLDPETRTRAEEGLDTLERAAGSP